MDRTLFQKKHTKSGSLHYRDGRLYFTGQLERRFFFVGTIVMIAWGLLDKLGIL